MMFGILATVAIFFRYWFCTRHQRGSNGGSREDAGSKIIAVHVWLVRDSGCEKH